YTSGNVYQINSLKMWRYSNTLERILNSVCRKHKINVIHIHGVWMYPQYKAAKYALKNKIPYIISPHGMYEPWLWEKGSFKKIFYFNFLTKKLFSKATFIHTITPDETKNILKLFHLYKTKTFEIPNLVHLTNYSPPIEIDQKKENYILYLGRLNQKKGIDILIKSFSEISKDFEIKLYIAGGFSSYKNELDVIVNQFNMNSKIIFLGLIEDENIKNELYKNCWVFASPSHSEVIGMVNLEAAMCKTPVLT